MARVSVVPAGAAFDGDVDDQIVVIVRESDDGTLGLDLHAGVVAAWVEARDRLADARRVLLCHALKRDPANVNIALDLVVGGAEPDHVWAMLDREGRIAARKWVCGAGGMRRWSGAGFADAPRMAAFRAVIENSPPVA